MLSGEPFRRWVIGLSLFGATLLGCRFLPEKPHWIEAFGKGKAVHIAAFSGGALVVGSDKSLYKYPGRYARPWDPYAPGGIAELSSSQNAQYAILQDGTLAHLRGGQWRSIVGSRSFNATALGVGEDGRVFVVSEKSVRKVRGRQLGDAVCHSVKARAVVPVHEKRAFIVDEKGKLYESHRDTCSVMDAPVPVRHLAANADRIVIVGKDGSLWRKRKTWEKLPPPIKYRPGREATRATPQEVAVSAHSTWLLDTSGAIFVLSDEA